MKDNILHFSLRIPKELLAKVTHIAEFEIRSKNKVIERAIKSNITEFEKEHGKIDLSQDE